MSWQYRVIVSDPADPRSLEQELNECGLAGWELVAVVPKSSLVFVFKRPA